MKIVGAVLVDDRDEIMLISTGGVLIRTPVSQIREMGRSTQGVETLDQPRCRRNAGWIEKIVEPEEDANGGHGGNARAIRGKRPMPGICRRRRRALGVIVWRCGIGLTARAGRDGLCGARIAGIRRQAGLVAVN